MAGFGVLGGVSGVSCSGGDGPPGPRDGGGADVDAGAPPDAARVAPWWLRGNYAPVRDEIDAATLEVVGALPPELDGVYLRNGPNPRTGASGHWFVGDGMLHGVRLQGGRALWYRNRYVRTSLYEGRAHGPRGGPPDLRDSAANTALVLHAGRILALYEAALPVEVREDLSTVGLHDFAGMLARPMSAHPKLDPVTGEMLFHAYSALPPHLSVHRVDPSGRLVRSVTVSTRGPSMMHDFAITERRLVFLDLPVVFDFGLLGRSPIPFRWNDRYGARIGVMPREGTDADVRWFDVAPGYVFHTLNAWDEGERVVLEGCRSERIWVEGPEVFSAEPRLHRWTLDLATRRASEARVADAVLEFPQVAPAVRGRAHRYGYAIEFGRSEDGEGPGPARAYRRIERGSGGTVTHDFGPGRQPDEPTFVPHPRGRGEDEGWILGFVYDRARDQSELVVLDATRLDGQAVARVRLPRRVPFGFHGLWVPARTMGSG